MAQARRYHPRGHTIGDAVPRRVGRTTDGHRLASPSVAGARASRVRTDIRADIRAEVAQEQTSASAGRVRASRNRPRVSRHGARGGANKSARAWVLVRRRAAADAAAARRPKPRLADPVRRLRVGTVLILAMFAVIAVRLVEIQLTEAPAYAADGLRDRLERVELPAPRGSILDRNGNVLAGSEEARYVYVDPQFVDNPRLTAEKLSEVLGVPRSELLPKIMPHKHADGRDVRFEYLARGVSVEMGQRVSALNLPGIGVRRDERRIVPGHDLAANVIGFTGRDLTGLGGLEASFDELLRGTPGVREFEVGRAHSNLSLDHEIPGGYHRETPARPGSSLQLTIDQDLQFEIQGILGETMRKVKATFGAAVVLDVRTGEVLALASYPFFDAANPLAYDPAHRGDAATGITVEPGSVHKAIVMAACLQEGVVRPDDTVLVPPSITKGDTRFVDVHRHSAPVLMTLPGILALSSNVGTITLADRLGAQRLYEYQRAFGLGEPTRVGLPGEAAGLVQPPKNWSGSSYGSIPIGLGVSVTPLQMAAVYATIANGGVWVQPHLVQAVVSPDGTRSPVPVPSRRVISAANAAALRTMLEAVVTVPGATGLSAKVPGYRVAGKTGTGKTVENGRYAAGEVASFIGMAPADAPRYVIAVFAHTPGGAGGSVAGPAFAKMMRYTLLHYAVAPTGTKPPKFRVYA